MAALILVSAVILFVGIVIVSAEHNGYVYHIPNIPFVEERLNTTRCNDGHLENLGPNGGCKRVYKSAQFRIMSPFYPSKYPPNVDCLYIIHSISPNVCELEINFNVFNIPNCPEAYLRIGETRICGSSYGVRRYSISSPITEIYFRSGSKSGGIGFDLNVQQIECPPKSIVTENDCGAIFTTPKFIITSPGLPGLYPHNKYCMYDIYPTPSPVCHVDFTFLDFDIEESANCVKDRLEIGDEEFLCGHVTGTRRYPGISKDMRVRFISDSSISDKGFRILVTQVPCSTVSSPAATVPTPPQVILKPQLPASYFPYPILYPLPSPTPTPIFPPEVLAPPNFQTNLPLCCGKIYKEKYLLLVSPGFPNAGRQNFDCAYRIQRFSSDTCRISVFFKYFWVGQRDRNFGCYGGFIEIDGRRICGCQNGLELTFQFRVNEREKFIRYVNNGAYNGFVMEIFQEKCFPIWKRSSEALEYDVPKVLNPEHFNYETYFPLNGSVSITSNRNSSCLYTTDGLNSTKNMQNCSTEAPTWSKINRGKRFTSSDIDIFSPNQGLRNANFLWSGENACSKLSFKTWLQLAKELFWKIPSKFLCPVTTTISTTARCQIFDTQQGSLQSPNYPGQYPSNLRCCYRFVKLPGFCRVKVTMLDFDVEPSFNCEKDHFLFGKIWRYCGSALYSTISTLELTSKPFEDAFFVSDSYGSGRGFRAVYQHEPCYTQIVSPPPSYNYCVKVIQKQQFELSYIDVNSSDTICTIRILRSHQVVCELQLTFESFDLPCGQETLEVGNKTYCGSLSGKYVNLDFKTGQITLIYRRFVQDAKGTFRIRGQQVAECDPFTLNVTPAARFSGTSDCRMELNDPFGVQFYPSHLSPAACSYVFNTQPGMCSMLIEFPIFHLQTSDDCTAEYFVINQRRYCGSQLQYQSQVISMPEGYLEVPYSVNPNSVASGWNFTYTQLSCAVQNPSHLKYP